MKKKLSRIAKLMFKASLKNGTIDKTLVNKVLKEITSQKPYGLSKILKIYKRLVARKLAREEVTVEAAAIPPLDKSAFLKKTGAKRIILKKNPGIVFGAKITHGDWIWEETLDSKLNQIKSA